MTARNSGASVRGETRRRLRERRRALIGAERRVAQARLARELLRLPAYRRARCIAVYFGIDGEVDLDSVIADARRRHKAVFAPVLAGAGLRFVEIPAQRALSPNRYGIPEPRHGRQLDPRRLDLVLTPVVGFDCRGTRLGMGKGYYDRTFAFLKLRGRWIRPKLVGIAFAFQELSAIVAQSWDVRLWAAVTDRGVHRFEAESEP